MGSSTRQYVYTVQLWQSIAHPWIPKADFLNKVYRECVGCVTLMHYGLETRCQVGGVNHFGSGGFLFLK